MVFSANKNARLAPVHPIRRVMMKKLSLKITCLKPARLRLSKLVRDGLKAFIEWVGLLSGQVGKMDISDTLRKHLARTSSVDEFFSIKDFVGRHIKDYANPKAKQGSRGWWLVPLAKKITLTLTTRRY